MELSLGFLTCCSLEHGGSMLALWRQANAGLWRVVSHGHNLCVWWRHKKVRYGEALGWDCVSWRKLPEMTQTRTTACEFKDYIYLCGNADSIDVFDPFAGLFLPPLEHILPSNLSFLVFVDNNQLVFLGNNYLSRFEAAKGHNLVLLSQISHNQTYSSLLISL